MKKIWLLIWILSACILVWLLYFVFVKKKSPLNQWVETGVVKEQNVQLQTWNLQKTGEDLDELYQNISDLFEGEWYEEVDGEYWFTAEWF